MSFTGFDLSALSLLGELPTFDKARYAEAKDVLTKGLRVPGAALMASVASALDPLLHVDRRTSVAPLHRDLRFAKAGTPLYKDNLTLTAWRGDDKKIAPTLWIRIDSEYIGFACGQGFSPDVRDRWRKSVGESSGKGLATHLHQLKKKRSEVEIAGSLVKGVPKPWPSDHPRADLLKRTGFQVRFREAWPSQIHTPAFAGWCEKHLRVLLPVYDWLIRELAEEKHV